jgi:hypothetical protein
MEPAAIPQPSQTSAVLAHPGLSSAIPLALCWWLWLYLPVVDPAITLFLETQSHHTRMGLLSIFPESLAVLEMWITRAFVRADQHDMYHGNVADMCI